MSIVKIEGLFWKAYEGERDKGPPEPVWLKEDYLPYLEESKAWKPDLLSDEELIYLSDKDALIFDIECYPNYFLLMFLSKTTGKYLIFEKIENSKIDTYKLKWIFENFLIVGFNSINYDLIIAALACNDKSCQVLFDATQSIIDEEIRSHDVLRKYKTKKLQVDHIDLIELTKLGVGLKKIASRLHAKMIMDLPFRPGTILTPSQIIITRWYCSHDCQNTLLIYNYYRSKDTNRIGLREQLSGQFRIDLRSKSDAQMAEAIFKSEIKKRTGRDVSSPPVREGTVFQFRMPPFVGFVTENLKHVHEIIKNVKFRIKGNGEVDLPEEIENLAIPINNNVYKIGIGGLHSQEESIYHLADDKYEICDFDVASYYPKLILATMMFPEAIGPIFREIYTKILNDRLIAKQNNEKIKAEGLKITANGTFGKTLSQWSIMAQPELGIQTTISGQLFLLMLVEFFELKGFPILQANTDGIVVKIERTRKNDALEILKIWEAATELTMEETNYKAIYSRDVNNYLALKMDGTWKRKGVFAEAAADLSPPNQICNDAVMAYLRDAVPVEVTIRASTDITKFITLREGRDGCCKNGEYLGKNVRWYYSTVVEGEIISVKSGNRIPRSEDARPIMRLPDEFPDDVNFDWYIAESKKLLNQIGVAYDP